MKILSETEDQTRSSRLSQQINHRQKIAWFGDAASPTSAKATSEKRMDELRMLRAQLQAGLIERNDYEQARLSIVDRLTGTQYRNWEEEARENPYSTAAMAARKAETDGSDGTWGVRMVIQPATKTSRRKMGWFLDSDGQHKYNVPRFADGTAFVDTSKGALRRSYCQDLA